MFFPHLKWGGLECELERGEDLNRFCARFTVNVAILRPSNSAQLKVSSVVKVNECSWANVYNYNEGGNYERGVAARLINGLRPKFGELVPVGGS